MSLLVILYSLLLTFVKLQIFGHLMAAYYKFFSLFFYCGLYGLQFTKNKGDSNVKDIYFT